MEETKYGVNPRKEILRDGMKYGFERMCIIHEVMDALEGFFCLCNQV